jgi:hypothetical protein
VPVRGELVPGPGNFEIEVLDADPRRVKRVRIYHTTDRANGRNRLGQPRPDAAATGQSVTASLAGHKSTSPRISSEKLPSDPSDQKLTRRS